MKLLLTTALLLALGLAGCANDSGGQTAQYEGALAYNGTSAGSHTETADCGSKGTFHWSVNLAFGSVEVSLRDANGATIFSDSMSGTSQTAYSKSVSGAPGEWTLTVARKANSQYGQSSWSGQYAAYLDC